MTSLDYKTYNTQEEHLDVVKATIYFNLSNNIQEIHRFKPITLLPISTILGEMLGVFIVFFLHYWKNN